MVRGEDHRYFKTMPGTKHFTAYDLENWGGVDRFHFNAIVTAQDLEETFHPPFKAAISSGNSIQVMCSYNSINGIPACAHGYFLTDVLREAWQYTGLVVSDCGALKAIFEDHNYTASIEEAVKVSLKAGTDLNCGYVYGQNLEQAYKQGLITMDDIDAATRRVLYARMRTGEFDTWDEQPYRKIPMSVVASNDHLDLSLKIALESMVLLKNNENAVLPLLSKDLKSVAVIGPHYNSTKDLQSDYSGPPPFYITPIDGVRKYVDNVEFSRGCDFVSHDKSEFANAKKIASEADATILFLGTNHGVESEGRDRTTLVYPGVQLELMQEIKQVAKGPVILVVLHGGPIDMSWEKENIDAIVDAGFPSMFGGEAIARVLFGDFNPSGRLSYTVYPADYVQTCKMSEMKMRPSENCVDGRTYRFYQGEPIYEFGFGLSYTTFDFKWIDTVSTIQIDGGGNNDHPTAVQVHYAVNVTNTGKREGAVAVLAFISNTFVKDAPKKQLFGFQRIDLKPGEERTVYFVADETVFEHVDTSGQRSIAPGKYVVSIGGLEKPLILSL